MEKKKPGLAVLIALKAKNKDQSDSDSNRHQDSAQEMIDAIKDDDAKLFGELLNEYVKACLNETEEEEEEEDSEPSVEV